MRVHLPLELDNGPVMTLDEIGEKFRSHLRGNGQWVACAMIQ